MVWQVVVPGTQTVTLTKASFNAVKLWGCGPASTVIAERFTGLTVTVVMADWAVFCVEVAVIVTAMGLVVVGAVKSPAALTEPAVAVQLTVVMKLLPVPFTVA